MPRRRTVNLNLPEGMRARTWSSGRTYYYLEAGGKTTPLGPDYLDALRRYCDLVQTAARPAVTWLDVVKRYQVEALPAKARKTQIDEISRLKRLNLFFAEVPTIDQIEPRHLRQYQQWRLATKAAAEAARRSAGLPPTRAGDGKVAAPGGEVNDASTHENSPFFADAQAATKAETMPTNHAAMRPAIFEPFHVATISSMDSLMTSSRAM